MDIPQDVSLSRSPLTEADSKPGLRMIEIYLAAHREFETWLYVNRMIKNMNTQAIEIAANAPNAIQVVPKLLPR